MARPRCVFFFFSHEDGWLNRVSGFWNCDNRGSIVLFFTIFSKTKKVDFSNIETLGGHMHCWRALSTEHDNLNNGCYSITLLIFLANQLIFFRSNVESWAHHTGMVTIRVTPHISFLGDRRAAWFVPKHLVLVRKYPKSANQCSTLRRQLSGARTEDLRLSLSSKR